MYPDKYNIINFVSYKTLTLWDVKRYLHKKMLFDNAIKLCEILKPATISVSKDEMISNNWRIISKINFSGQLYLRDISDTKNFKGSLNLVEGGCLIYSKINVKHGCVYYHPLHANPFGVSSEYPVFKVDTAKVLGEYLVMLLQSGLFKSILNRKTTGISKSRVKVSDFLSTEIPIPAFSTQLYILNRYHDKIREAQKAEIKSFHIEKEIESYFIDTLGITIRETNEIQRDKYKFLKFIYFQHVFEWGIDIIKKKQKKEISNYPIVKIHNLCQLGSGGTPPRSRPHYYKGVIPWVKTGEVINEEILDTEEHITEEAIAKSSAKLYPKGSLIIAMYGQGDTRGRTAKLGVDATTNQACAVLYDIDNSIVITDYLWYYLQGRYHDLRSMASGNNQPNLNAGKIKNYDVIVPPLDVQEEMVTHIKRQKALSKQLKQKAIELRKEAITNFENSILKMTQEYQQ